MVRFSANLGFLFTHLPLVERIGAAAKAGFGAVEMHLPYDVPAEEIRDAIARAGVAMLALNAPYGDSAAGEFGLGALPGRETEFQDCVDRAMAYGSVIGANAVHCLSGVTEETEAASRTFADNLAVAADKAAAAGMGILIEPINHRDRPGYFLNRVEQAAEIIARAGRTNVRIMFDCYHVQIMQGDLIRRFEAHRALIGHVQVAAVPSRAEPDEGEIDYAAMFRAIDAAGYAGWIGAEYRPRAAVEDGLGWRRALTSR